MANKSKTKKKNKNYNLLIGLIAGVIGLLLFVPSSLVAIGDGHASGVAGVGIFVGLVAGFFSVQAFLEAKKNKKDKLDKGFIKSIIGVAIAGVVVLSCIIAIIADPIAKNVRCSSFNSKEEMSLDDSSVCRDYIKQMEEQKQAEENAKNEAIKQAKEECSAKDYDWNSSEGRCNTDDEQEKVNAEKKAKSDCSAKNYNWNSSEGRCNTDSEQQIANQKKAEEEAKRAEANKTTTYTGKDHDDNDYAGRYDKLMNACWDKLDEFWTGGGVVILDSDSGYPISYSVTLKGDGTLVEGTMTGNYRTKSGKIKPLYCTYNNGTVKITGIE